MAMSFNQKGKMLHIFVLDIIQHQWLTSSIPFLFWCPARRICSITAIYSNRMSFRCSDQMTVTLGNIDKVHPEKISVVFTAVKIEKSVLMRNVADNHDLYLIIEITSINRESKNFIF